MTLTMASLLLLACQADGLEADRDDRLELMRTVAEQYVVVVKKDDSDVVAELNREPLLRWSNPIRNAVDGTVFLWTDAGRPVAALCVYPNEGDLDHEWQSLSVHALRAEYPAGPDWSPVDPGVEFRPVPKATNVADSTVARLSQMRILARRFSASVHAAPRSQELRLLTQPVYRYPDETPGAADGAVFSFGQGTDPELLLILEARKTAAGLHWYYALAPMSGNELACRYRDEPVWKVESRWPGNISKPYMTFLRRSPGSRGTGLAPNGE